MRTMTIEDIRDRYGEVAKAARREPVVHTSDGEPVLVTISIKLARQIPALKDEIEAAMQRLDE